MENSSNITCKECGKLERLTYIKKVNETLKKRKLCHDCNYWQEIADDYLVNTKNHKLAVIDGHVYAVCPRKDVNTKFNGFGGREFKIKFKDGEIVETNNLWNGAKIPSNMLNKLPNNAEFIQKRYQEEPGF